MKRLLPILVFLGLMGHSTFVVAAYNAALAQELNQAIQGLCERIYKFHSDNENHPGFDTTDCKIDGPGTILEKIQISVSPDKESRTNIFNCGQGHQANICSADGIPPDVTIAYSNIINYLSRANRQNSISFNKVTSICYRMISLCRVWSDESRGEFEHLNQQFLEIQSGYFDMVIPLINR